LWSRRGSTWVRVECSYSWPSRLFAARGRPREAIEDIGVEGILKRADWGERKWFEDSHWHFVAFAGADAVWGEKVYVEKIGLVFQRPNVVDVLQMLPNAFIISSMAPLTFSSRGRGRGQQSLDTRYKPKDGRCRAVFISCLPDQYQPALTYKYCLAILRDQPCTSQSPLHSSIIVQRGLATVMAFRRTMFDNLFDI
jgi:hypothetical protein